MNQGGTEHDRRHDELDGKHQRGVAAFGGDSAGGMSPCTPKRFEWKCSGWGDPVTPKNSEAAATQEQFVMPEF